MANVDILIEALENIQSYGQGACSDLAKKALVDFGNAEYAGSQQGVEGEATTCAMGGKCDFVAGVCQKCRGIEHSTA